MDFLEAGLPTPDEPFGRAGIGIKRRRDNCAIVDLESCAPPAGLDQADQPFIRWRRAAPSPWSESQLWLPLPPMRQGGGMDLTGIEPMLQIDCRLPGGPHATRMATSSAVSTDQQQIHGGPQAEACSTACWKSIKRESTGAARVIASGAPTPLMVRVNELK